jgi:hypothetical protein
MRVKMIRYLLLAISILISSEVFACAAPSQGTGWTHEELIDGTDTILLVELVQGAKRKFSVIETLKGTSDSEFVWRRFRPKEEHQSTDFNGHTDNEFWAESDLITIRTGNFRGGMCYAQFTFVEKEQYLVFVESVGHFHSAEIIKSKNDKWYNFVKSRIAYNKKSVVGEKGAQHN